MKSSHLEAASKTARLLTGIELAALLLAAGALYVWLGWAWLYELHGDQGWFLQVSQRVASGERLYGDVLWCYGPLPVLLMSSWMKLGRHDVALYSALNLALAFAATGVLYALHRGALPRRTAAWVTFGVMVGFATATLFLRSPSAVVGAGYLGALLTLLGIFRAGRAGPGLLNGTLIAGGVACALLSKHEFAFAVLVLSTAAVLTLFRVRCTGIDQAAALRQIGCGSGVGLACALAVYGSLVIESGWKDVWAGVRGYALLDDSASILGGAWFHSLPLGTLVALLGLVGWLGLSLRAQTLLGRGSGPSTAVALLAFITMAAALRSGMLERVLDGSVSVLDVAAWRESLARQSASSWMRLAGVLVHALLWCMTGFLFLAMLARWTFRWWRREQATHGQWLAWVLIICMQTVALRSIVDTASPLNLWGLPLLACLMSAEFPRWSLERCSPRSLVVAAALLCGLGIGFARGWQVAPSESVWMSTPYGRARVPPRTRDFLGDVVAYLERNTSQTDAIAVLGRWAGIWYVGQRRDPFRAGYQVTGMGAEESDAAAFLERLDAEAPAVVLAPQGAWNVGLLDVRGQRGSLGEREPAFGHLASQVERKILESYSFDRLLSSSGTYEVAAFKRVR